MCTVTPADGTASGVAQSDSVVIDNQQPAVSQVSVTSTTNADGDNNASTAVSSDTLSCSYTFSDLDGDADQSSLVWTVGGVQVGSGATLSGAFAKGDTVLCTVTPNDGTTTGPAQSATLIIDNQVPVVSGLALTAVTNADGDANPNTGVAADTLECGYSFSDGDGDADASTTTWTVGGTVVGSGLNLSDS